MNPTAAVETKAPVPVKRRKPRHKGPAGPRIQRGTPQARRLAAAILEVLGGTRLPSEAAEAIGVSLPRYYALENRALDGMVEACEPKGKGRTPSPERALGVAKRENDKLRSEIARKQALLRVVQRTVGLPVPQAKPLKKGKRRRRKPSVRALRAVSILRSDPTPDDPEVQDSTP